MGNGGQLWKDIFRQRETAPSGFRFQSVLGKFIEATSSEHRGPEWGRNVEDSQEAVNKATGKAGEPDA